MNPIPSRKWPLANNLSDLCVSFKTSELEDKYDYLNDRLETQLASFDERLEETRDMARIRVGSYCKSLSCLRLNLTRIRLENAWSNWSEWSKCSVTCNIGSQFRIMFILAAFSEDHEKLPISLI